MSRLLILPFLSLVFACTPAAKIFTPPDDMPFLHVAHPAGQLPYVADAYGRQVILRGVNSEGLEDEAWRSDPLQKPMFYPTDPAAYLGKCPANSNEVAAPLCEVDAGQGRYAQSTANASQNDFAQMRQRGVNFVRLALSWSQLEAEPGNYKTPYLEQVAQVVGWAKEQGVYVLLDMHQDQYSRSIQADPAKPCGQGTDPSGGFDGAPAWAVLSDGKPSCATLGQAVLNGAVSAAFDNFWKNTAVAVPQGDAPGTGLQDHWIGAMAALARRFKDEPAVIGYEIINEPQPGSFAAYDVSDNYLYPFYAHVVQALTGVRDGLASCPSSQPTGSNCAYPDLGIRDTNHLVFFEPIALRNLIDFSPQHSKPFSTYPNLVFAPHTYSHVFTIDASFLGFTAQTSAYPPSYDYAYATAAAEALAMDTAIFVTEFGGGANDDAVVLAGEARAQEHWGVGAALWTWKSNCSVDAKATCEGPWGWFNTPASGPGPQAQNGPPQPSREKFMVRVYPRAIAGRLVDYTFDPGSHAFALHAVEAGGVDIGDKAQETLLWIPADVTGAVAVNGAATLDEVTAMPDGNRFAWIAPTSSAAYSVWVGDAAALDAKLTAAAPRQPIDQVTATTTFKQFIVNLQSSPDSNLASKAVLVQGIVENILKIAW
jgi:aryl-phospho-beta-D-glucosidase BglC (GH1 family)